MRYNITFDIPNSSGNTSGIALDSNGVQKTLLSIDWKSAIEQAENIFDSMNQQTNDVSVPYIIIKNPVNKYELHFTIARNQKLESKVLTFLSLPREETVKHFFGLLSKKRLVNNGASGLIEPNEVIEIADLFFKESYENLSNRLETSNYI